MGCKCSEFEKELYVRIDEVVHYIWDPIGISSHPGARDEYYAYLPTIFGYIKCGDIESLEKYMTWAAAEHMDLSGNQNSIKSAISIMLEWKLFLEEKFADGSPKIE